MLQAKEDSMISIETFLKKFNRISFKETPKVLLLAWEKFFKIKHREKQHPPEDIQELIHKLLEDVQNISSELAGFINSPSWSRHAFYLDDDEEYTIAITPDLPTEETEYSLSMGDEHLSTIPEKESDELIKSSVENLVPIPSESEVTSDNKSKCNVPINDESSPTFTTFSNHLFDSNDDFTFSDDESLSDEDVPKENFKIYSNPLFDDEEIISTKIDPHSFNAESNLIESLLNRDTLIDSSPKFDYLLEEFSGELAHIDPIPPGIEKADFDLEEEIRLIIESPSLSPILIEDSDSLMEEIDLFLASDDSMPPGIEDDDYDSEGDICFLEELINNDSLPLPENESSNLDHFNDPLPSRPPPEPPDVEICFDFEPDTGVVTWKITLKVGNDKITFKSDKPTSNIIKRVYALGLRERLELDLEARLMGEALILKRSLDPTFGDYIELNDLNKPVELRRNQVEDLGLTIEDDEVIDKPMIEVIKTRNDDEEIEGINEYPNFYDVDKKIHICAYNLHFSCMIGFEHVNINFFPILSINLMSRKFYNSIIKDKVDYKGKNVVGAFINVPIFVGNFFVVTHFVVVENRDAYRDERMDDIIVGKLFCRKICVKTRRLDGVITIYNGNNSVTYHMVRSHPRFKHLSNAQCNKMRPLMKVSAQDELNGISHPYQKLKSFYKGVLKLETKYASDAKIEEWLARRQVTIHKME
ncbi:hypothetical protein Tco_1132787 [Tanacetum coccineum]|uniref:Uncharacterized protein n=1 Tax=Tanacetum coccineum TaxID=301880 RepID=A0ABQ5JCX9_9ASTR